VPSTSEVRSCENGLVQSAQSAITVAPRSSRHELNAPLSPVNAHIASGLFDGSGGPESMVGATGSTRSSV